MFGIDLRSDTPYRGRRAPAGAVLGGIGMEDGMDASTPDSVEAEVNPTIDDVDGRWPSGIDSTEERLEIADVEGREVLFGLIEVLENALLIGGIDDDA